MRVHGRRSLLVLVVGTAASVCPGCASRGAARAPEARSLHVTSIGASADPTVHGARLLPETVDETQGYGTEPGGGLRAITAGLRVVATRDGALLVASDRLPRTPQSTVALPDRLGGGFLFVLGSTVWRADHWLDAAKPIFTSLQSIQTIEPGLDRVYVRADKAYLAIDGKTGRVLDLGPWPASPFVSSFAAADGWRAAAVTDLRGVVATFDAGATWRPLDVPMDPREVLATGDAIAIGGIENGKTEAWFEVRGDGTIARLKAPPREAKGTLLGPAAAPARPSLPGGFPAGFPASIMLPVPPLIPTPPHLWSSNDASARSAPNGDDARDELAPEGSARTFGRRPLAAAIEDGWPLTDGTAVVARDGALGRVRLSDGALIETALGAFPLKPARCHAVSLHRDRASAIGAFGFVCGEPRGATLIYAYDPSRGQLSEVRRFDRPRVVTSSGNGALAVRGPCAEDGDASLSPREPTRLPAAAEGTSAPKPAATSVHPYCIFGADGLWREIHVRGDADGERLVVLTDGKVVVVSPPRDFAASARVTVLDKGLATTQPIVFSRVTPDVARVLHLGVWLDGFEERKPGVVGGWIEAGGAMLGVEITLDGNATAGQFVRDAGMPFVSGRYGFGWTPSRRGFETTDGGMTWTSLELPEPLVATTKVERRACGPIGCLAAGWLRVGWGEAKTPPSPPLPPPARPASTLGPPQLSLACEATQPPMPTLAPPKARAVTSMAAIPPPHFGSVIPFPGTTAILGGTFGAAAPSGGGVTEMPAFFGQPAPILRDAERGIPFEVQELPERYPRLGALARIYAWGPTTGAWETLGKWQVRWLSPFAGWTEAHGTLTTLPPQVISEFTRSTLSYSYGGYYGGAGSFQLASGDDPAHALLLARRQTRADVVPIELEVDRGPVEIKRADGEPFVEIDAAIRAAGRWFIATPPLAGSSPVTTVWQIDGGVARELARVTRAALETGRPSGTKLARRSDGRAVGLVVDGQPTAERSAATRWVMPIDLETGTLGEPEPLGYGDLAGRTLEACTDDFVGWVFDTSLPATTVRARLSAGSGPPRAGSLHSVYARVRLSAARTCVERIAGMYDDQSPERVAELTRIGVRPTVILPRMGELIATAFVSQMRAALRCTVLK